MSVSTLNNNERFLIDDTPEVKEAMPGIVVSPEGVQALLSRIKLTKVPDPDVISSGIQEFSKEIPPALKLGFSTSLDSEELPQDWLHARVSPGYKGGNKN